MMAFDDRHGIGTAKRAHAGAHSFEQPKSRGKLPTNQVRDDFGIGARIGIELVAQRLELGPQRGAIIEAAVQHHGDAVGNQRMGAGCRGRQAYRPVGVRNAGRPGEAALEGQPGEPRHASGGAHAAQGAPRRPARRPVEHGNARRIVAPVLDAPERLEKVGNYVPLGDSADDSTHGGISFAMDSTCRARAAPISGSARPNASMALR